MFEHKEPILIIYDSENRYFLNALVGKEIIGDNLPKPCCKIIDILENNLVDNINVYLDRNNSNFMIGNEEILKFIIEDELKREDSSDNPVSFEINEIAKINSYSNSYPYVIDMTFQGEGEVYYETYSAWIDIFLSKYKDFYEKIKVFYVIDYKKIIDKDKPIQNEKLLKSLIDKRIISEIFLDNYHIYEYGSEEFYENIKKLENYIHHIGSYKCINYISSYAAYLLRKAAYELPINDNEISDFENFYEHFKGYDFSLYDCYKTPDALRKKIKVGSKMYSEVDLDVAEENAFPMLSIF